jgi:hypothetical protein
MALTTTTLSIITPNGKNILLSLAVEKLCCVVIMTAIRSNVIMLGDINLNVIMNIVIMVSVIMMSVIIMTSAELNAVFIYLI